MYGVADPVVGIQPGGAGLLLKNLRGLMNPSEKSLPQREILLLCFVIGGNEPAHFIL
jgi:hypothetical protein